jgi:hypothetical protein
MFGVPSQGFEGCKEILFLSFELIGFFQELSRAEGQRSVVSGAGGGGGVRGCDLLWQFLVI